MDSRYDIAVIGSGLGGLVSAYILARNGLKVAVFEKEAVVGGCLQTFVRQGVKFETGMHYIGSMREGETMHRFFRYLGLLNDVRLSELDRAGYDIISFGGERYPMANGREEFVASLAKFFPHATTDLRDYVDRIGQVATASPLYSFRNLQNAHSLDWSHVSISIDEALARITANPTLQNVLAGNMPLYAGEKGITPFYYFALISDFYLHSAFRVVDGSDAIAQSLVQSVRRMGGDVFTRSEVCRIECDEERATAVVLASGERVECRYVVSDIYPELTMNMLDTQIIRRAYRQRIASLDTTVSNFTVYLKFREGAIPYMNRNFYHYSGSEVWGGECYTAEDYPRSFLYMHQCSSADQRFARGGLLLSPMRWSDVERWADTKRGARGEEYEQFKAERAERLIAAMEREMPHTREHIEGYWTSSPLTYRDYTGTKHGSMYGVLRDARRPMETLVAQRTRLSNLILTGQNINAHGILGVIIGAVLSCSEIIDLNTIIEQIRKA